MIRKADALMEARPEYLNPTQDGHEEYNKGWNDAISMYWDNLNNLPAKTQDRPKGEWIEINNGADTTCECSECHHRDYIPNVKTEQNKYECMDRYWFERNFCPNCGSDNRERSEE